jgi:hypothetical protein
MPALEAGIANQGPSGWRAFAVSQDFYGRKWTAPRK